MTFQDFKTKLKASLPKLRRPAKAAAADLSQAGAEATDADTAVVIDGMAPVTLDPTVEPQALEESSAPAQKPRFAVGLALQGKLKAKLGKFLPARATDPTAEAEGAQLAIPAAQVVKVDRHHCVFGLDWRFYTDSRDLNRTVRAAQREGFTHRVMTQTEDLVGIGRIPAPPKKAKLYSASLQLAQSVSMGGVELFVFKLEEDLFCLVALNDSRPIIGFEKAGTRAEIMALAGEFQLSQVGYNIRQAGNTGALEHEEPIKLSEAFGQPDEITRVKPIPDFKVMALKVAAALGVAFVIFSIYGYVNEARIQEDMKKMAQARDPNFIYEREVVGGMKSLGLPAQVQIERWRAVLRDIPVQRKGWSLTSINCLPDECTLSWAREFGSYAEFFGVSLPHELRSTEAQAASNPAISSIQTTLKVPPGQPVAEAMARENLPSVQTTQRLLASQLQDFSLLEKSAVELKTPELFPSPGGVSLQQVNKPVVRGEWGVAHEIWSLDDLSFNIPAMVAESLSIVPLEKLSSWSYTLKGRYYAKGKDF